MLLAMCLTRKIDIIPSKGDFSLTDRFQRSEQEILFRKGKQHLSLILENSGPKFPTPI